MPLFSIDSAGYFTHNNQRIFPVGVNYWPATAGVEMWKRWPLAEILHDLDVVKSLGLNTVRFFLRWQDFEPAPGEYDDLMFERLRMLLGHFRQRQLITHPSLFVGWMSGGVFWPSWRQGRNVFADPYMQERAAAFAKKCAEVMYEFADCILAIDQGNELCCLEDCQSAPPEEVIRWCGGVNAAIRQVWPEVLIISGNEHGQVINDSGWRFGQQPGCDLYSMHAYPVPNWHPVPFNGLGDPLSHTLLPLYVRCARAFGPVMVQEFGTIITFDRTRQDSYLKAVLPGCWDAGANGFLWWCLRDVTSAAQPYQEHGFEATLGLVDANDKLKPGLEYYVEFAKSLSQRPLPQPPADAIGIYWPEHYYNRQPLFPAANTPRQTAQGLLLANYFLRQIGDETSVIRGDQPIPATLQTLIVAGCSLSINETRRITEWVRTGGRLIWHGVDTACFGPDYIQLMGAVPIDYRAAMPVDVDVFGKKWTLTAHQRNCGIHVEPTSASIVASAAGVPMVLKHRLGRGTVICVLPQVEQSIAAVCGAPGLRNQWAEWYRGVKQLSEE